MFLYGSDVKSFLLPVMPMIDFNNKGFFKLKQNNEYAERVSALLLDGEEVVMLVGFVGVGVAIFGETTQFLTRKVLNRHGRQATPLEHTRQEADRKSVV